MKMAIFAVVLILLLVLGKSFVAAAALGTIFGIPIFVPLIVLGLFALFYAVS